MTIRYNYPVHRARNLFTAIALAERLRKAGDYDMFRGQVVNHPLVPSAFRPSVNQNEVVEKLNEFYSWVMQTPELASLHGNTDLCQAVGQHYGLPTTFMDFSFSPVTAGYFASHTSRAPKDGKATSCIICANSNVLIDSWSDLNQRHYAAKGSNLVRLVKVDVKNLWRLQSQQGLFLDVHVDSTMLEMFSFFLHIEFPWSNDRQAGQDADIYPVNKSHLETLLDQYFLIATYPQRKKAMLEFWGEPIYAAPDDFEGESSFFIGNTLPPVHSSWEEPSCKEWLAEPDEKYTDLPSSRTVQIETFQELPYREALDHIVSFLANRLETDHLRHAGNIIWQVIDATGSEVQILDESVDSDEAVKIRAGQMVQILFDGLRNKPCTDRNICSAIALYVLMCSGDAWNVVSYLFEHVNGIEFSGGSTRARGFADTAAVRNAVRGDILDFVKPEKLAEVERDGFLGIVLNPRRLFVFERFCELFIEQALPTAAIIRIEGNVLPFNAARIDAFGLS